MPLVFFMTVVGRRLGGVYFDGRGFNRQAVNTLGVILQLVLRRCAISLVVDDGASKECTKLGK